MFHLLKVLKNFFTQEGDPDYICHATGIEEDPKATLDI